MKVIQLSTRLSLILAVISTTIIHNQIFTGIKPAFSKNKSKKSNKIKFSLPAPPPGKTLIGRTRGGGRRGSCPDVDTTLTAIVPFTQKTLKIGNLEEKRQKVWGLTTQIRPQFPFYVPFTNKHSLPTEFILKDEKTKKIVYQSAVNLPNKPGVIHVYLPKTVKPLEDRANASKIKLGAA
ncbi:MAG: DUF928 domain-containing protein [Rivularia sp. ALOHA_DT_140]|nr:DUF928 domain-containing protein [Rivularia sp. ALOHA_DT_140]